VKQELVVLDQSIFGARVQVSSGWPVQPMAANEGPRSWQRPAMAPVRHGEGPLLPRPRVVFGG
jgi:hypothetical protein